MPVENQRVFTRSAHGTNWVGTHTNLYLTKTRIGLVSSPDRTPVGTNVRLYVPEPKNATDRPSIHFRLSNGAGSCFTRFLNLSELDAFASWLVERAKSPDLAIGFDTAIQIQETYETAFQVAQNISNRNITKYLKNETQLTS